MDESVLKLKIKEQGDKVRLLKTQNAEKDIVEAEVATLLEYKKQLENVTGESGSSSKSKNKFVLKTPKGTRDYNEKEMAIREKIFNTITGVFKKHGAVTIDTPVFELKEILAGKYGEDGKLIFDLDDQGGEKCSLRYDLTVPFARFLAMNGTQYQNIKRYHIAKVYRRDQPAMTKGRMREFYQCDFDVAGSYDPMVADSEVVRIMYECLTGLDIGKFTIKINHRKILDGIFEVCGVPKNNIRPISSAVDKLDKLPWEDVKKEMTEEKGLDPSIADKIGEYVKFTGGRELLEKLSIDQKLNSNQSAKMGLDDMKLLFDYLEIFKLLDKISFDLSLARGLDYYTGIIYEAVTEQSGPPTLSDGTQIKRKTKKESDELDENTVGVGSIAAGGRYDNLVGMFASSKKGNIPCVGVSIGVERVFSILLQKEKLEEVKANEVEVYVMSVVDGLLEERMRISAELWDAGIKAEFMYKAKPKLQAQFSVCDRDQIPFAVIIGKDELSRGEIKIKDMRSKEQGEGGGVLVKRTEMISELKKRLQTLSS
ncbi:3388_t:CDS:10 [Ambispora gerdemannii]|uniref:Histidine--tRNA ligase, mitochondrial n=1 Tax=Ambispora gerdemannii TaxID=144530 RepID=A0A9N9BAL7_9GLOM|nr:3388_t:CDS:10 [Ambispora gerdemannii]